MGELIRVLPGIYDTRPEDIGGGAAGSALSRTGEPVTKTIEKLVAAGRHAFVACRSSGAEQKQLSVKAICTGPLLIDRIVQAWRPRDHE